MAITHSIPTILHVWEQTEEGGAMDVFQFVQKKLRAHVKNGNCRLESIPTSSLMTALDSVTHKWEVQLIHFHKHRHDYYLPEYEPLKANVPDLQAFKNLRLIIVSGDLTVDELKSLLNCSPVVLVVGADQKILIEYYYATLAKGKNIAEAFEEIEGTDMQRFLVSKKTIGSWAWFDSENILGNVSHALYSKEEDEALRWNLHAPVRLRLQSSKWLPSLDSIFSSKATLFIAAFLLLTGLGLLLFLLVQIQSGP